MLSAELKGQKFETPKTRISFRKSESVSIDDDFIKYAKENGCTTFARELLVSLAQFSPVLYWQKDAVLLLEEM